MDAFYLGFIKGYVCSKRDILTCCYKVPTSCERGHNEDGRFIKLQHANIYDGTRKHSVKALCFKPEGCWFETDEVVDFLKYV
jgi:hypothetical protein